MFKRLQYAGIRLITLGEGEISAPHVGLKGTMNALFLKDLADKVRRGLRGRMELAQCVAPAPQLHPYLAEVYRQKIALLADALRDKASSEAREIVRGLVERIVLVPEGGRLRVEVRAELGTILRMADAGHGKGAGISADALVAQVKVVAGTGNHRQLPPLRIAC